MPALTTALGKAALIALRLKPLEISRLTGQIHLVVLGSISLPVTAVGELANLNTCTLPEAGGYTDCKKACGI